MKKSGFWQRVKNSPFLIKLKSWEYWPMHLIYAPIYAYWIFLSIRARAFFFFSGANPGIFLGGLFMESKMDIYARIPDKWIPKTAYLPVGGNLDVALQRIQEHHISFPLIAKPDKGERGFWVEVIENEDELGNYLRRIKSDCILQEYIDYPVEIGVLYYRFPGEQKGTITSVTLKKFLSVTGDGKSTVRELVLDYPRARLQLEVLEESRSELMVTVPENGEEVVLVSIGNHCKGTTFLGGNHLIDSQLTQTFDEISSQLEGIYFGRFDIRCQSVEALKAGQHFKILEINGVKSEPTHIYDPGFSIWEAYRILFRQWNTIYQISMANKARGFVFPTFKEGFKAGREYFRYRKTGILEDANAFSPRNPEFLMSLATGKE